MKKMRIFCFALFCLFFLPSCNLIYSLFSSEHEEGTKIKKITNTFSLTDRLACSASDSQDSTVKVNKFLVLDDGTYIVCDDTIGIKIQYPDKSIGKIWYGDDSDDYRKVGKIYYSEQYDRIYVEGGSAQAPSEKQKWRKAGNLGKYKAV